MRYTPEQIAHIEARYPHATCRVIAAELGRSIHSVRQKAKELGIKRTARQKSAIYRTWARRTWTSRVGA